MGKLFTLIKFVFLLIAFLFFSSCGYYSFSSSVSGTLKTIAIPLFDNRTSEYGLREALTQGVVDNFIKDNTLKVTGEKNADSILRGTVTAYERKAHTYTTQETIKEYIVYITVKASFENLKEKKIIWQEDKLTGWGIYAAENESEDDGKARAVSKLAEDIVNLTVKGW